LIPGIGFAFVPHTYRFLGRQSLGDAYVDALVQSGAMPDASHLWWAIRPSLKYPTLELRAPDCCTRLDDTIAIAALTALPAHG
jgi:gamma-glutamyl:cysteine ligase YbdK (ATP-grasp superfamily)